MDLVEGSIMEPLTVTGTRILTPAEYHALLNAIPKLHHRTLFIVCFWSGMRYVEVQRLHAHPEWWMKERGSIHLPKEASKKVKRVAPERSINPLPPQLESELPHFFNNPAPPVQKVWNDNLKRWMELAGLDPKGMSSKTTRKTIESWMLRAGMQFNEVCLRQGHDQLTSLRHYQTLAFTGQEKDEIKRMVKAWI